MNKIFTLLLVLLLLAVAGCARESVTINGNVIKVEVADTQQEREQGLMFKEFLPENNGMLFIFDDDGTKGFWMRNTLIPLDMIFIDANLNIADIHQAEPCASDVCPVYNSKAKYVLEVNQGYSERHNIRLGDKVETGIISTSE
jgi:uncharacterized membrane protein (UPF0127 family)